MTSKKTGLKLDRAVGMAQKGEITARKSIRSVNALLGILTITLGVSVQLCGQGFLTNGLVAYYPFSGNAIDASGHGNDGVTNNVTFVNNAGRASARFSGTTSSFVEVPPGSVAFHAGETAL